MARVSNTIASLPTRMSQHCSRGQYCRAIRLNKVLTDDNFRKPSGGSQYYKSCNLCRNKPAYPRNGVLTADGLRCNTCWELREQRYFTSGIWRFFHASLLIE